MHTRRNIFLYVLLTGLSVAACGCSTAFWGGTAAGGVGAAAAYEVHSDREVKKLDEDLKSGKITQQEYDIRKDQISRDSIFQ